MHRALCSLGSAIAVAAAACRRQADGDDPEDRTDQRYAAARSRVRAGPTQRPGPSSRRARSGAPPLRRRRRHRAAAGRSEALDDVGDRRCPLPSAMALTMAYAELGLCVGRTQRGEGGGDGDLHRPRRWRGAPVSASNCDAATGPNPRRSRTASDAPRRRALRRGAAAIRKLFRQHRPEVDVEAERRQLEAERRQSEADLADAPAAPGPADPRPPQRGGDPDRDRARTRERRPVNIGNASAAHHATSAHSGAPTPRMRRGTPPGTRVTAPRSGCSSTRTQLARSASTSADACRKHRTRRHSSNWWPRRTGKWRARAESLIVISRAPSRRP